jgi:hypothetical protein
MEATVWAGVVENIAARRSRWTMLRVESDFPERRQQSNERNMKTSAGEKLLGRSECRDPRQPERPVDWTRV